MKAYDATEAAAMAADFNATRGAELQQLLDEHIAFARRLDAAGKLDATAAERLVQTFTTEMHALVQSHVDARVGAELAAARESGLRDEAIAAALDAGLSPDQCAGDYVDAVLGAMLAALRARQPNP